MSLGFNISFCPAPFLDESAYPYTKGNRPGRVCSKVSDDLSCSLPCPTQRWVFSNHVERNMRIAYWFNVPALACQVFLLLSFAMLPKGKSHGHYLAVGLCISLAILELASIVPLGAESHMCYDAVTPANMYTDLTCAWSGAFLEFGAMASCIWTLLRSIWIFMRVCLGLTHVPAYVWISPCFGWGIPAVFLAVAVPVSGLSYRIGRTCIPNEQYSFVTWSAWILAFAGLAAVIQLCTTGFCLWLYARHFWHRESAIGSDRGSAGLCEEGQRKPSVVLSKGLAWNRVRKMIGLQWRSIVLSFFVIIDMLEQWAACLVFNVGNKDKCLKYANVLGLNENVTVSRYFMAAFIGIITFLIKIRRSIFVGWYELFRYGSQAEAESRKRSLGRSFASSDMHERRPRPLTLDATGILPEPIDSPMTASSPEAGDVTRRHDTTNWFDSNEEEELNRTKESSDSIETV